MPFSRFCKRSYINAAFFRKVGELLGYVQLAAAPGEEIFVGYDETDDEVRFTKAGDKLYYYTIAARELASDNFSPECFAEVISFRWEGLK